MKLTGVHTAMVTPFRDGAVDLEAYRALCLRQLEAGIDGIVVCGTTGETPALSDSEWIDLVAATVEVCQGRVPVTAGCGSNSTSRTVRMLSKARQLGVDAGLVVFPYYNKPNPHGHKAHVAAAARVGLPLVLYHVPGRTGQRLDGALLSELCAEEGVVALKEATGDVALSAALLDHTDVALLSGDDFTFAAHVAIGGHGVISVVSNLAPAQTRAWYQAAATGDRDGVVAGRRRLMPTIDYLFSTSNPVPAKAAMARMGLCRNELRLPLAPIELPPEELVRDLA